MSEKETIFLTVEEALAAIRTDFSQYGPQKHLFLGLCPLILGKESVVVKDAQKEGVWVATSTARRMRFMSLGDLGEHLCMALEKASSSPDLLAGVCRRVFRTAAHSGRDEDGKRDGIWLETGMEAFSCRQCGLCCRTLNFRTECTVRDYEYWEALGRIDIMEWVSLVRQNNKIVSCRIWVKPGTRHYAEGCPWLRKIPDQDRFECRIHDVRPGICRQYPGSRKHAEMTGCMGFIR